MGVNRLLELGLELVDLGGELLLLLLGLGAKLVLLLYLVLELLDGGLE